MRAPPKRMLIELPVAEEIDGLATNYPEFRVRKFEYDIKEGSPDLNRAPCKGQIVLVVNGEKGTVLLRSKDGHSWALPNGSVLMYETPEQAARRVAKAECGLGIRSMVLTAMYDVSWHYPEITVKRLHLVYAAVTDDFEFVTPADKYSGAEFRPEVTANVLGSEIDRQALEDSIDK